MKQHYSNAVRHNFDLQTLHRERSQPTGNEDKNKEFQFPREKKKMEFIDHNDEAQSRKR